MCSIIGFEKREKDFKLVKECFNRLDSRGPDGTRYFDTQDGLLGFKRLAIMGLDENGMQPFILKNNAVVCNGEIYGFKKIKENLKKEYLFQSESDCEIILPLFEKYGYNMFKMLDSEFAMIIYDEKENKLIVARDPIGIRPLYYGISKTTGGKVFASEPKALLDLVTNIEAFPPGHYYDGEKFICFHDVTKALYHQDSENTILKNLHDRLVAGVLKRLDSDAPLGFLLSGGLDSSLVCSIAQKAVKKPIRTFAIGMDTDAIDLKYAKEVAKYLKTNHQEIIIHQKDVIDALREVIYNLGTYDITTIRASIGMYLICKEIHLKTDIRVLLTGEISDELFGYKYTDFAPTPQAFQEEAKKRIKEIHMYDVLRADRCISSNSLEARVPFGDLAFVDYVMRIPPALKMNTHQKGKYLLRKAFEGDYLPHSILYREKAAFSDAVGHSMVDYLKEYAEDYYTDEEYFIRRQRYEHAQPFTKESLLYREIFEEYYPNLSSMIVDFWMPNQNWDGCKVNDPSARVLANYGESSK